MSENQAEGKEAHEGRIRFHYLKSSAFRVVYAEGAYGGLTPHGNISISFYNDRYPIPQIVEHQISQEGKLGGEISRVGKDGVVREVEVDVLLTIPTAKSLRDWLEQKILEAEQKRSGAT